MALFTDFSDIDNKNFKILNEYISLLSSVKRSKYDAMDSIDCMLKIAFSMTEEDIDENPPHEGFGFKNELYRVQAIIGEIGKEIVFRGNPQKETLLSLVHTLKIIRSYL